MEVAAGLESLHMTSLATNVAIREIRLTNQFATALSAYIYRVKYKTAWDEEWFIGYIYGVPVVVVGDGSESSVVLGSDNEPR